ncbi:hypothetical protein Pcinc_041360 [Petrolisthes cinctipes]|uniref:Mismatch repair endonuclease PMS2 n=1 Tax=Petrolisthes cinctipes TaxID=88211 RepID=A0AAE1BMU3_PETCI|nr:hypothetical protein Pcinc_041360 [Petrolisthes cinctipes]
MEVISGDGCNNGEVEASQESAKSIKAIDKTTVHRICSGQVVLTLATAVKELVENSLDAGATSVEVKLKDHGATLIEVLDNGSGVEEKDFEALTLKHHTSKLRDFEGLEGVSTFGFRGEALSSLCALSQVSITTRHVSAPIATKLTLSHNGIITDRAHSARQVGTTVSLQGLFSTLPVRYKEFQRNIKREFNKMVNVLYSYCLISTGVRITCTNQTENGKKSTIAATSGHPTIKDNISAIFGAKQVSAMLEMKQLEASEDSLTEYGVANSTNNTQSSQDLVLEGWVSSCAHGLGRPSPDRQFYFVNSRPCDPTRVAKVVNEVYRQYNRHQSPCVVLNLLLGRSLVDVNLTPDKRQIMLASERIILAILKTSLMRLYETIPSTYNVSTPLPAKPSAHHTPSPSPTTPKLSALTQRFGRNAGGSTSLNSSPLALKRSGSEGFATGINKQPRLLSFFKRSESESSKATDTTSVSSENPTVNGIESQKSQDEIEASQAGGREGGGVIEEETACSSKEGNENVTGIMNGGNHSMSEGANEVDMLSEDALRDLCETGDTEKLPSTDSLNDNLSETRLDAIGAENEVNNPGCHRTESIQNGAMENGTETPKSSDSAKYHTDSLVNGSSNDGDKSDGGGGSGVKSLLSRFSMSSSPSKPTSLSCPSSYSSTSTPSPICKRAHSATNDFLNSLASKRSKINSEKINVTPNTLQQPLQCDSESGLEVVYENLGQSPLCDADMNSEMDAEDGDGEVEECSDKSPEKKVIMCEEYDPSDFTERRNTRLVNFDLEAMKEKLLRRNGRKDEQMAMRRKFKAKISPTDNTAAEDELRREITKDKFAEMKVLGQFNLGFILARLGSDLFIIDQHATDEKYNFENLQHTCTLNAQRSVVPQKLELTAANESILLENMAVFRKNGFVFSVDEDQPAGRRVSIVSKPFSKGWEFGREDVEELIFMLSDAPGVDCRPSRVRAMFASRACRSAVMIGTALTVPQMTRLVQHMGEMEHPWNCPHGRPTMRHLLCMDMLSATSA